MFGILKTPIVRSIVVMDCHMVSISTAIMTRTNNNTYR